MWTVNHSDRTIWITSQPYRTSIAPYVGYRVYVRGEYRGVVQARRQDGIPRV